MKYGSANSGFKTLKIVLFTLLGLFIMGFFGFFLLCNVFFKKAMDYNNSLPVLKGTIEITDSVRAPLSGERSAFVLIKGISNRWNPGDNMKDELDDFFDVLYYKSGAVFKTDKKRYVLMGQRPRFIIGNKKPSAEFLTTCGYENQPPIPHSLDSIDAHLDYYIGQLRKGDCGFGTTYHRFSLAEYCYSTTDTITIKVSMLRNDTIFMDTTKY